MQHILLQEIINAIVVLDLHFASLQVLYPVSTSVLQLGRDATIYGVRAYLTSWLARVLMPAYILPKTIIGRHDLNTTRCNPCMRCLFINKELPATLFSVYQEIVKREVE
jgi:hypothetical protein